MGYERIDKTQYDWDRLVDAFVEWKKKRHLTCREIGSICGLNQSSISKFVNGYDDISLHTVQIITECAKIDLNDYLSNEPKQEDTIFDFEMLRQDVKSFLAKKGMSQCKFASTYGFSVQTVNNFLTSFHTGLREQTIRHLCGSIGKPYSCYLKEAEKSFKWVEGRNLWQYRFTLDGTKRTVYGKTKQECEERAEREINEALRKMDDKVEVAKCPDGNCRIDITEVYKVVNGVIRDALEKTFEQFLEKHLGEYKRRRKWSSR